MATTLWVKGGCRHCDDLREELLRSGEPFTEIDIEKQPHLVPELLKLTNRVRIVPVRVSGIRIEIAPQGGTTF
ncbi:MAG: hypothetical protein E4H00_09850 [Myxococcales bacterium]|jgi:glutaredoxin|nr:MAG: hypothetical protein E4H00_09850 [Myxococcales bacterium]